ILPRLEYAAAMGKAAPVIPSKGYGFLTTYITCLVPIMLQNYHNTDPWVVYVLDRGTNYGGQIIHYADKAARNDPSRANLIRFLSIRSESSRDFVPLQAADILAYELYRFAPYYHTIQKYSPKMKHLRMLKTKYSYWVRLN